MSSSPSISKAPSVAARLPWFTLTASAFALGLWFWSGAFAALAYQRDAIFHGEWCRLLTGHWVHFSGRHLFWNLAVFLPAGIWLERLNPSALRWTLVLSPLVIGLALLAFDPSLATYAGISGVASAVLVALAVHGLRTSPRVRFWWWAVLLFFAAKVAFESRTAQPLNSELAAQGVRSVPLAHLVGALIGATTILVAKRR